MEHGAPLGLNIARDSAHWLVTEAAVGLQSLRRSCRASEQLERAQALRTYPEEFKAMGAIADPDADDSINVGNTFHIAAAPAPAPAAAAAPVASKAPAWLTALATGLMGAAVAAAALVALKPAPAPAPAIVPPAPPAVVIAPAPAPAPAPVPLVTPSGNQPPDYAIGFFKP